MATCALSWSTPPGARAPSTPPWRGRPASTTLWPGLFRRRRPTPCRWRSGCATSCSSTPAKHCTCWSCAAPPRAIRRTGGSSSRCTDSSPNRPGTGRSRRPCGISRRRPPPSSASSPSGAPRSDGRPNPLPEVEDDSHAQVEVMLPSTCSDGLWWRRRRGWPGGSMARATHRLHHRVPARVSPRASRWRGRWSRCWRRPRSAAEHEVRPGENLTSIARRYGVSVAELARLNQLEDPNHLLVGAHLHIPSLAPAARSARSRRREESSAAGFPHRGGAAPDGPPARPAPPGSSACRPLSSWP